MPGVKSSGLWGPRKAIREAGTLTAGIDCTHISVLPEYISKISILIFLVIENAFYVPRSRRDSEYSSARRRSYLAVGLGEDPAVLGNTFYSYYTESPVPYNPTASSRRRRQ